MENSTLVTWYYISQILLFITAFFSAIAAGWTVYLSRRQRRDQAFLHVVELMSDSEFRKFQSHVIEVLKQKDVVAWDEYDQLAATAVAHRYNQCGIMIKLGIIPKGIFLDQHAFNIVSCHNALSDFIIKRTKDKNAILWLPDFRSLYDDAKTVKAWQLRNREVYRDPRLRNL